MADKQTAIATPEANDESTFLADIEREFGSAVVDASVYGGGELTEKDELIGTPFVVTDFEISQSDTHTRNDNGVIRPVEFAVVRCRTIHGERVVFTDGGTGILPVLLEHEERTGKRGGLVARKGLRRSDYTKKLDNGTTTAATTFYFG
jgi:hypothetical protein